VTARKSNYTGTLQSEMIAALDQRLQYENVTLAELARRVGVNSSSVYGVMRGADGRDVTVPLLESYALALGWRFRFRLERL
jgi:hypothetical protein